MLFLNPSALIAFPKCKVYLLMRADSLLLALNDLRIITSFPNLEDNYDYFSRCPQPA